MIYIIRDTEFGIEFYLSIYVSYILIYVCVFWYEFYCVHILILQMFLLEIEFYSRIYYRDLI